MNALKVVAQHINIRSDYNPRSTSRPSEPVLLPVSASPAAVVEMVDKEKLAQELGSLFDQALDIVTKSTALKLRQDAYQKVFDKSSDDYKRGRPQHEKFPQVEETQRKNRERAEKDLLAIKDKSEKQSTILKDMAFKGASTVLPGVLSGLLQDTSLSRRNDELEKTCKDLRKTCEDLTKTCQYLQSQFDQNRIYIEEQKHTRIEDERKKQEITSRSIEEISILKDDFRALKSMINGLPQNLRQKLQHLEDKVKDASALDERIVTSNLDDINKEIRQLKNIETLRKERDLAEKVPERLNNIEERHLISTKSLTNLLSGLDKRIDVTENDLKADASRCTALEDRVNALEKELKAENEKSTATEEKVVAFGREYNNKLSGFTQTTTNLQNNLASLNTVGIERKFTAVNNEIGILKAQSQPTLAKSSSAPSSTNPPLPISSHGDFDKEDIIRAVTAALLESETVKKIDIISTVTKQVAEAHKDSQDASDRIISLQFDVRDKLIKEIENRYSSLETAHAILTDHLKPVENFSNQLQQLRTGQNNIATELEKAKKSMVDDSIDKVVKAIESTFLPQTLEQLETKLKHFSMSFHNINQIMSDRIKVIENRCDGIETAIVSFDKRIQNINTADFARFLLDHLQTVYPNANSCQDVLTRHEDLLNTTNTQINDLVKTIDALPNKHGSNSDAPGLQSKFDAIEKTLSEIRSLANDARKDATEVRDQNEQDRDDNSTKFAEVGLDIGELRKSLKEIAKPLRDSRQGSIPIMEAPPVAMVDGPPSILNDPSSILSRHRTSSRTPTLMTPDQGRKFQSNGQVARKSAVVPTATNQFQGSVSAASDNGTKKRKLNGSPVVESKGTNGVKGSPKGKGERRRRHKAIDGDDTDDEDFQPKNRRIIFSDDEEN